MRVRWMPLALVCWLCGASAIPITSSNRSKTYTHESDELLDPVRPECACAAPCACRCAPDNASLVLANCRGAGLAAEPDLDLPRTLHLQMLDLRENRITHMDIVWVYTALRDTRVRLSGNPLACDCAAKPVLTVLRMRQAQVEDYDKVKCAGGDRLRDVDLAALCSPSDGSELWIALTAVMAALLVFMALVVAYRRYRDRIKRFLFGKGWCLHYVLVKEPPSEAARSHDVFVSFGEHDEPLVAKHLLPRLEEGYRACWYARGFAPGPLDVNSLAQLVQSSRRMIIVVSRNFLSSSRNMAAFRTAYTSALSAGNMRMVAVCLDDTAVEDFPDPDLRFVLKTNPRLLWSDPKFWTKLRYELPHYPHGPKPPSQ